MMPDTHAVAGRILVDEILDVLPDDAGIQIVAAQALDGTYIVPLDRAAITPYLATTDLTHQPSGWAGWPDIFQEA